MVLLGLQASLGGREEASDPDMFDGNLDEILRLENIKAIIWSQVHQRF
jgi:hypothetical protein